MASVGKGAKAKGSNFERTIAKQLNEWWGEDELFTRTPASGGLRWQSREDVIGDISTPENFTHTIECKNREDWKLKEFFSEQIGTKDGGNIACWWYQAVDEARRARRLPWLIIKKNYVKPLLIWSNRDIKMFVHYRRQLRDYSVITRIKLEDEDMREHTEVRICGFEIVLSILDPKHFITG